MRLLGIVALFGMCCLTACGGGSGGGVPGPNPTSTPPPNFACPTSGSLPTSIGQRLSTTIRRSIEGSSLLRYVPGEIAVTYSATRLRAMVPGARVADLDYGNTDLRTRVIAVDDSNVDSTIAQLRTMAGVERVGRVHFVRRLSTSDPYYAGFAGTSAPYYETSAIPGQWDMHVMNMDGAWSQLPGGYVGAPVIGAPVAVIDTGVDVTHPELVTPAGVPAPKISRTQCYVTYPDNTPQTSGPYVTDTDGHGTNVAGIADADTNNGFAFASVAFDAPLLAYRIFPTDPSGGCEGDNPPAQCFASSADEASAINDAVAHGAKVVNLSLGSDFGGTCNSSDPEYVAVENAIAHGVVVVAAAGNGAGTPRAGRPYLDCPAGDPGVIAVGATSINDSNSPNAFEYVASYSNYLSNSGTANGGAYLVAPGGDPAASELCGSCTVDHLHWIENIYSTTGVGITPGTTCAGAQDYAQEQNDCNALLAGTSQATPHVAGVASLMLAKNPRLTPAQIAAGLCASTDDIADAKEGCGRVDAAKAVTWASTH